VRAVEGGLARHCGAGGVEGHLVRHHAPAVEHFGGGALKGLEQLGQLVVVVEGGAPAQDARQVVAGAQRQHADLALLVQVQVVDFFQDLSRQREEQVVAH